MTVLEPDDRPRARQPLPELDDDLSNNQPSNTTNDSIDRSIEFDIGPSPNRIKASYGGALDDHRSNIQLANGHRERSESIRAFDRADPSPELN
jgi:hypothetical protein